MTIAVTAATGQLGTLVVDALLERTSPDQVVAIVRDAAKAEPLAAKGVAVRVASYDDPTALKDALAGVDQVLLISGNEFGQRAVQHRNVIDAAIANNVSRLVYTSAPKAETSTLPVTPEHLATEQYLATAGIDHVLLRNNWYHENYGQTLDTARQTGSVLASAGEGLVASAARADYAEAAAVVLTTDGPVKPVHELAGDVAWTQDELAAALTEVLGTPITVSQVTAEQQTAILVEAGLDEGTAGFVAGIDAATAKGDLALTNGDLRALLGRPTTPLVETLRALA
ncbi:SDR family oxidoreductase [Aeromicrobium ginsengisoli]|uniref:SDR family oxidoreductase n=1 Tax=Aeromicrobium ginsengisoli TaxID=363867 RepID=A0A5M4FJH2_9ACTN|nr:SDR family oxidoreductase [Aeromicrobium ginsengisoli]KAA1400316.1 SDR family oxidoreductase [Aeromicrobium ginsengisoli]